MTHMIHMTAAKINLIHSGRNALHLIDAAWSLYAQAKELKGLIEITADHVGGIEPDEPAIPCRSHVSSTGSSAADD